MAERQEPVRVAAIALVLALGCASCSPSGLAARDQIHSALRLHDADTCDMQTVVEHEGLYGTPHLVVLRRWLYGSLLRSKRIAVLWERRDDFRSMGEVSYVRNGATLRLWWNDYHPPAIAVRRSLELRTCLFQPKRVDLVDTIIESGSRELEVRYMPIRDFSWIGRQLRHLKLLNGNNSFEPLRGDMETAWLEQDASGIWRVKR